MRKFALVLSMASLMVFLLAGTAFAFHMGENDTPGVNTDRGLEITSGNCGDCHENDNTRIGPHGGYTTSTDKCQTCHDIHGTAQNVVLLQGTTVTEACNYCHDLTTSVAGPYYSNGLVSADPATGATIDTAAVRAAHRVAGIEVYKYKDTENEWNTLKGDVTSIPGGNDSDGTAGEIDNSTATDRTPYLSGKTMFTCDSCHTPHGFNTVKPYLGESEVKLYKNGLDAGVDGKFFLTSRILKQKPNNVNKATFPAVTSYGSKWCAQCHQGQDQFDQTNNVDFTPTYHNHPVNEDGLGYMYLDLIDYATDVTYINKTKYDTLAAWNTYVQDVKDGAIGSVTIGSAASCDLKVDPRNSKQFAMVEYTTFGNTWDADGNPVWDRELHADGFTKYDNYPNGPACQQCHGSARDLGAAWSLNNPARRNFPHISANTGFLVERGDDFCLNCHGIEDLP